MAIEDQLFEKQLVEAINHIKNVNKRRVMIDCVVNRLKKTDSTNWDQESINDMLCILQCKGFINDKFRLAESQEESTN